MLNLLNLPNIFGRDIRMYTYEMSFKIISKNYFHNGTQKQKYFFYQIKRNAKNIAIWYR